MNRPFTLTLSVRLFLRIVIVVFFKCIAELFNPIHRRGGAYQVEARIPDRGHILTHDQMNRGAARCSIHSLHW